MESYLSGLIKDTNIVSALQIVSQLEEHNLFVCLGMHHDSVQLSTLDEGVTLLPVSHYNAGISSFLFHFNLLCHFLACFSRQSNLTPAGHNTSGSM